MNIGKNTVVQGKTVGNLVRLVHYWMDWKKIPVHFVLGLKQDTVSVLIR